jgi:DNA polymerase-4
MFVAVARRADPEGAGKAKLLVVGGSARSRGVVCSASWEAREFGLHAGMPISRAVRLCPQAMYVPVPGKECSEAHRSIRKVLAGWAPVVEPASVDEFYLDLTGTERLYHDEPLVVTAQRVRESVRSETGFTLSIGGATNRLVAKMAAERAKPRPGTTATGVLIVAPGEEAAFMADRMLAEIPGVGPKLQAELKRHGLTRVCEALALDQKTLTGWVGNATGRWLYRCIRGESAVGVEIRPENKSISHESTFSKDLTSDESLESRLLRLLTALTSQLRKDRLAAGCITVKLRDHDFRTRQAGRTLREPLSTDRALFTVAKELLRRLREQRRVPARLIGVSLSALRSTDGPLQFELTIPGEPSRETSRDRLLADAVDRIARKLGAEAIRPARLTEFPSSRLHLGFRPPK